MVLKPCILCLPFFSVGNHSNNLTFWDEPGTASHIAQNYCFLTTHLDTLSFGSEHRTKSNMGLSSRIHNNLRGHLDYNSSSS